MSDKQSITVTIGDLTEPQRLALEDLFATWMQLGGMGGSRWTAFYADGDGDFRPKITVNGATPKPCDLTDRKARWKILWEDGEHGMNSKEIYLLDFDAIAWALHKKLHKKPAA